MRELTRRQVKFVRAYVANAGNGTQAAISAGYPSKGAAVEQNRLLTRPHILAAIREETLRRLSGSIALGAAVLVELAEKAKDESVRLRAAESLLNRGGLLLPERREHLHIHATAEGDGGLMTREEMQARIRTLAERLGIRLMVDVTPAASRDLEPAALPAPANEAEADA